MCGVCAERTYLGCRMSLAAPVTCLSSLVVGGPTAVVCWVLCVTLMFRIDLLVCYVPPATSCLLTLCRCCPVYLPPVLPL